MTRENGSCAGGLFLCHEWLALGRTVGDTAEPRQVQVSDLDALSAPVVRVSIGAFESAVLPLLSRLAARRPYSSAPD